MRFRILGTFPQHVLTLFDRITNNNRFSEQQNTNQTWNTDDPSFTRCFERTALVWAPCAFLWIASVLDIFYMRSAMNRNIPWGWLNTTKLIVTAVLMLISLIDMIVVTVRHNDAELYSGVHPVDFWTPTIKAVTFVSVYRKSCVIFNKMYL